MSVSRTGPFGGGYRSMIVALRWRRLVVSDVPDTLWVELDRHDDGIVSFHERA